LGGASLGEALLTPTRIYVESVMRVLRGGVPVKAMSHITGGGITENLDRALPEGADAVVVTASGEVPRVVELAVEAAGLSADEALKTFNMGIGFALILDPAEAPKAAAILREAGETVYEIGEIVAGDGKVVYR
jgi:phosphoribosylformylglycinamidine cyclo-ligase